MVVIMFFFLFMLVIGSYNPIILDYNLSNYFAILLLGGIFNYIVLGNKSINNNSIQSISVYLFYALLLFYCLNSMDNEQSYITYFKLLVPVIVYLYLCGHFSSKKYFYTLDKILGYMCHANILACLIGILFLYFNYDVNVPDYEGYIADMSGETVYRMKGTFAQANVYAGFLALTFPAVVYKLRYVAHSYKKYYYMAFIMNMFCLYKTYSRWSLIAVSMGLIITMFTYLYHKKRINTGLLIFGVSLLFALIVIFTALYNLGYFTHEGSNLERILALSVAFQYASDNDFFGYGLGIGISKLPFEIILDGTIINLLVDCGMVAILQYIAVCFFTFRGLYSKLYACSNLSIYMILWSFCIFFIISINETILYNTLLNHFFAIYLFASNIKCNKIWSKSLR